jgi:hypothetical protein
VGGDGKLKSEHAKNIGGENFSINFCKKITLVKFDKFVSNYNFYPKRLEWI